MSDAERELMIQHCQYWNDRLIQGLVIAFGPVDDPEGAFSLVLMRIPEKGNPLAAAIALCEADPIGKVKIGSTHVIHPMPAVVYHSI